MIRIFIFIFLSFQYVEAQDNGKMFLPKPKYESLFKTVPPISDKDPKWVHLLYSESPNYFDIQREYNKYYRYRVFEKNTHTQNFKHFSIISRNEDDLKEDGTVQISEKKQDQFKTSNQSNEGIYTSHGENLDKWIPMGPFETFNEGGVSPKSSQLNVYTFDQSISNSNILYAGGETGGVFKSINKGISWEAVGDDYNVTGHIESIKIDPNNHNVVYFSNGDGFMYKTIDGGNTWNEIFYGWDFQITAIEISPDNSDVIWIAGNKGFYKSIDGGNSWSTIFNDKCWDIKLKTDDPNTVFLTKSNPTKNITEILKSSDV